MIEETIKNILILMNSCLLLGHESRKNGITNFNKIKRNKKYNIEQNIGYFLFQKHRLTKSILI